MKSNSGWHTKTNSGLTIIFIHGLFSNSEECWKNRAGTLWQDIIRDDKTLQSPAQYYAGFHTEYTSGVYDIYQCGTEVLDNIKDRENGEQSAIDSENIIFVCHSLGGVICRHILERSPELFQNKKIGLILLASPTKGSSYADRFKAAFKIFNQKTALQLKSTSEVLTQIDNRFRDLLQKGTLSIVGEEACEQKSPKILGFIRSPFGRIVDEKSASNYFGAPKILAGTDHSSISKPDSSDHVSHKLLKRFIIHNFINEKKLDSAAVKSKIDDLISLPDPIFDTYIPSNRKHYIQREVDGYIAQTLKNRSVWIYGPSGSGKTCAARFALTEAQSQDQFVEIQLSQLTAKTATSNALYREIFESISPESEKSEDNLKKVTAEIIKKFGNTRIPIFLDETPVSKEIDQKPLLHAIDYLLCEVKLKSKHHISFVVCSMHEPDFDQANEKMREHFEKVELKIWSDSDLERLIQEIGIATNLQLSNREAVKLIESAKGSPRFIKTYFRVFPKVRSDSNKEEKSDLAITMARSQLQWLESI